MEFRECFNCKKKSKYECPKCGEFYCCLKCYKLHDDECVQEFYKEQVIQGLKSRKPSQESKANISEILRKETQETNNFLDAMLAEDKEKRLNTILESLIGEILNLNEIL